MLSERQAQLLKLAPLEAGLLEGLSHYGEKG